MPPTSCRIPCYRDQRRIAAFIAGFVDGCGIEPPFHLIANSATFPLLRCAADRAAIAPRLRPSPVRGRRANSKLAALIGRLNQ
jgi:hypothetical protein